MQKEKRIRFIAPNYKELFTIPDGAEINIIYPDATYTTKCRYLDDTHFETISETGRSTVYHICQFAEMITKAGGKYSPKEN